MRRVVPSLALSLAGCFAKPDPPGADAAVGTGIRYVRGAADKVESGTLSVTLTPPPDRSATIVVVVGVVPANPTQISDSAGNLYTTAATALTPAGRLVILAHALNAATATPFTVTATGTVAEVTLAVHEYAGIDASAEPRVATNVDTSAVPDSGSFPVDVAGSLVFGAVSHDEPVTTMPGPEYELRLVPTDDPTFVPLATEDRIAPAEITSAGFQLTGVSGWACGALVFRPQ